MKKLKLPIPAQNVFILIWLLTFPVLLIADQARPDRNQPAPPDFLAQLDPSTVAKKAMGLDKLLGAGWMDADGDGVADEIWTVRSKAAPKAHIQIVSLLENYFGNYVEVFTNDAITTLVQFRDQLAFHVVPCQGRSILLIRSRDIPGSHYDGISISLVYLHDDAYHLEHVSFEGYDGTEGLIIFNLQPSFASFLRCARPKLTEMGLVKSNAEMKYYGDTGYLERWRKANASKKGRKQSIQFIDFNPDRLPNEDLNKEDQQLFEDLLSSDDDTYRPQWPVFTEQKATCESENDIISNDRYSFLFMENKGILAHDRKEKRYFILTDYTQRDFCISDNKIYLYEPLWDKIMELDLETGKTWFFAGEYFPEVMKKLGIGTTP